MVIGSDFDYRFCMQVTNSEYESNRFKTNWYRMIFDIFDFIWHKFKYFRIIWCIFWSKFDKCLKRSNNIWNSLIWLEIIWKYSIWFKFFENIWHKFEFWIESNTNSVFDLIRNLKFCRIVCNRIDQVQIFFEISRFQYQKNWSYSKHFFNFLSFPLFLPHIEAKYDLPT